MEEVETQRAAEVRGVGTWEAVNAECWECGGRGDGCEELSHFLLEAFSLRNWRVMGSSGLLPTGRSVVASGFRHPCVVTQRIAMA